MKAKGKYIAFRDMHITNLVDVTKSWTFWVGIAMVLGILLITLLNPCPSQSQFMVYRLILSLGLGLLLVGLSKIFLLIREDVKIGIVALLLSTIYFFNPVQVIQNDNCTAQKHLKGIVYLNNTPLQGVQIISKALSEADITNGTGRFELSHHTYQKIHSIDLQLHYHSIDTVVHLEWPPTDSLLVLHLKDTIPKLSVALASELVRQFLNNEQNRIEAAHQRNLLIQKGGKVRLDEICLPYKRYNLQTKSERNAVVLENKFEKLNTQKAFIAAQIPLKPMVPYHSHYLDNYELYLYACDSSAKDGLAELFMHYAFLNKNPIAFTIESLHTDSKTGYVAKVSFTENIRAIETEVYFTVGGKRKSNTLPKGPLGTMRSTIPSTTKTGGAKTQTLRYAGVRAYHQFLFEYTGGQWKISGIKK